MAKNTGFATTEELPQEQESSEKLATSYESIKLQKTQIASIPNKLPIGWFQDEHRLTDFTLKPYTGEEELALSALTTRFKDRAGDILPHFLQLIVDTIGGTPVHDLAKSKSISITRLFEQMHLADALTVLLQLRLDNFGNEIQLAGQCPACTTHNKDREGEYSELDTVEINLVKDLAHPLIEVNLKTGAKLFDDQVKRIQIRPVRVYDLKRMTKAQQDNERARLRINHELLLHTVVGLPESEAYGSSLNSDRTGISQAGVEQLYKKLNARDRADLIKAVEKLAQFGPEMTCQMTCHACGFVYPVAVPWNDLPSFLSFPR